MALSANDSPTSELQKRVVTRLKDVPYHVSKRANISIIQHPIYYRLYWMCPAIRAIRMAYTAYCICVDI